MRKENNLLYYIKCHWKLNLLAILLQVLCAGISVLTNLAMIQMTQEIIERNMELFLYWMLLDFILWLIYCGADGVRAWVVSKTKMTMNNQVRADIVATMLKQSHQEFHGMHSGAHISWLTNDVNQIASLAWDPFYNIVELVASVVFSVAALAQMHWSLLTVSLFVAVIIVNAPKMFTKRVEMLSEDCAREQAEAMAKMKDLLAGVDVLRAFGRTKRFIDENRDASVQLEEPKHRQTYVQAFIGEGIDLVNLICQLSVNALIGILSIRGIIIQSALMGGGNLCGTIYGGLAGLSRQILSIRASKPYFQKITEREIREVRREWNATMEREIAMDDLSFSYGEKRVLKNASFRFRKGGKYALTGPSGCGKSTVLKLLMGYLTGYSGSISIDGLDARNYSPEQLQQQMSYIDQSVFLFNTTIRDNITLGEDYSDEILNRAIQESALVRDLDNMPHGLDTLVGENGCNLSGGQKQRVAIARALIHDRAILLIDEGTSALDQKNADIIEESLLKNSELTLIMVSHHLTEERKNRFTKVYTLEQVATM